MGVIIMVPAAMAARPKKLIIEAIKRIAFARMSWRTHIITAAT